ncbi:hypothetical protein ACA910_022331 [Epithemia clementina (nom. ined.)]
MADQNLNDGLETGSVNDEIETSLPPKNEQTLVQCNNETLPIAMVAMPDRASSSSLDVEEQEDPNESTSHRGLEQTVEELKKEIAELRKEFELKVEKLAKENAELKTENAELKTEIAELIKSMEKAAHYWNEDHTNNDFVDADSTTHDGRTESPPTLVGRTTTTLDACEEESEKKGHKVLAVAASQVKRAVRFYFGKSKKKN